MNSKETIPDPAGHSPIDPKHISINNYRYDLPPGSIAHFPLAERDASKLLIYRNGEIGEDIYRRIGDFLPGGALLVFNNTKVVEARILFRKPTGGQIELFCLEPPPEYGGITAAMAQTGRVRWKCLIGGASKWKAGQVLTRTIGISGDAAALEATGAGTGNRAGDVLAGEKAAAALVLEARYIAKLEDFFLVELSWQPAELSFAELLHRTGLIPLPPYIRRAAERSDSERYQTIYARHDGSVAAPTAGLHFTEAIFKDLGGRSIQTEFVTLHVGAGTFMPVKAPTMELHSMHVEFIEAGRATIEKILAWKIGIQTSAPGESSGNDMKECIKGPIIPVGTTSARTIESLYWLGTKAFRDPEIAVEKMIVGQWDAYEAGDRISPEQALQSLLDWMDCKELTALVTTTQLLITPGYDWKIAGGLVTNFHQPESTLLLLIASMVGEDWRRIYDHALGHGFRFLSYGDGCLFLPKLSAAGTPR